MKPENYNLDLIRHLALNDVTVNTFLTVFETRDLTWEQALIAMVFHLSEKNKELAEQNLKYFQTRKNEN